MLSPESVLGLADHLVDEGFTVVIPSPFGKPGKPESAGLTGGLRDTPGNLALAARTRIVAFLHECLDATQA